jgi:predicted DCC family thiol-disulfide oxidoreductase YuxK
MTVNNETKGWVFYDADCALCTRSVAWVARLLDRHGFLLLPLQTPGTTERLGITPSDLFARMHLITREGRRFVGADAFVEVGRHVRWAWPVVAATRFPGVMFLLRRGYDWIATHRYCFNGTCRLPRSHLAFDWWPLLILLSAAFALRGHMANWVFMWALTFALFAGSKWLTYRKGIVSGGSLVPAARSAISSAGLGWTPTHSLPRTVLLPRR